MLLLQCQQLIWPLQLARELSRGIAAAAAHDCARAINDILDRRARCKSSRRAKNSHMSRPARKALCGRTGKLAFASLKTKTNTRPHGWRAEEKKQVAIEHAPSWRMSMKHGRKLASEQAKQQNASAHLVTQQTVFLAPNQAALRELLSFRSFSEPFLSTFVPLEVGKNSIHSNLGLS